MSRTLNVGHSSRISSTLSACSAMVMIILMPAAWMRYFRSFGVSIVVAGQYTAPSLMRAIVKIHHSGVRGSISMTRSPFLMPYFIQILTA